ncbi:DNA-processing protein DprA [Nocardia sp. NBC_00881]|uniref:DNA-processing protein DprA n=1 Tax=Nocardia sp. NBC_00881 TaxID=2975995 RepID=UPI00386FA230
MRGPARVNLFAQLHVAVVGARATSDYGIRVTTDIAADLTDRGWRIISGGAFGADAATHRAVLARGGTTIAVVATGPKAPRRRRYARPATPAPHRRAPPGCRDNPAAAPTHPYPDLVAAPASPRPANSHAKPAPDSRLPLPCHSHPCRPAAPPQQLRLPRRGSRSSSPG